MQNNVALVVLPVCVVWNFVKTRMHFSRMRPARLCIVPGEGGVVIWSRGRGCCPPGPWGGGVGEGGVVIWSGGGGRGCCPPGLGGGRCCDLVQGGGRCCPPGPGGKVLSTQEGREVLSTRGEVLWPGPGVEGGVVQRPLVLQHLPPPRWTEWVTHTCENITFARFATRAVMI